MSASRRVDVLARHREYDGFLKLDRVTLRHTQFDGQMSAPINRLVVERGDAAAVLVYDAARDVVTLVEQFRYPAFARDPQSGWLLEVVAGTVHEGQDAEKVARQELLEEAGIVAASLEPLGIFFLSPGASTERVHLFLARVVPSDRVAEGGGAPNESEDIRVVEIPARTALDLVQQGTVRDAKTIIALQHLALWRSRGPS